jgi:Rha family phage regulatory protein
VPHVTGHFGKQHAHVLRSIREITDAEFMRSNFGEHEYVDGRGNSQPMYWMTEQGFNFVVSRMSGAKAETALIDFIGEFHRMRTACAAPQIGARVDRDAVFAASRREGGRKRR